MQFSDGRKATSVGGLLGSVGPVDGSQPVLTHQGGSGGPRSWRHGVWVWPLPPPGPLAFVCEWPAHAIALSRAEVDAGPILDAASRAETLWPPDDPDDRRGSELSAQDSA